MRSYIGCNQGFDAVAVGFDGLPVQIVRELAEHIASAARDTGLGQLSAACRKYGESFKSFDRGIPSKQRTHASSPE